MKALSLVMALPTLLLGMPAFLLFSGPLPYLHLQEAPPGGLVLKTGSCGRVEHVAEAGVGK